MNRDIIMSMLEEDGISSDRKARYSIAIATLEDAAFQNGRRFHSEGKTLATPSGRVPEVDVFKQEEMNYFKEQNYQEQENIERWSD